MAGRKPLPKGEKKVKINAFITENSIENVGGKDNMKEIIEAAGERAGKKPNKQ